MLFEFITLNRDEIIRRCRAKVATLGLGLAFSRWATQANDGQISARRLPGDGCIFTIELPRGAVPALATL